MNGQGSGSSETLIHFRWTTQHPVTQDTNLCIRFNSFSMAPTERDRCHIIRRSMLSDCTCIDLNYYR